MDRGKGTLRPDKLGEYPYIRMRVRFRMILRFKYTTKFSLPKIACPAIVYVEIVGVIDPFFVGVCLSIKVYRYNPTEICQQRLQGVRNVAQKLCSWERSFKIHWNRMPQAGWRIRNHAFMDSQLNYGFVFAQVQAQKVIGLFLEKFQKV